MQDPHASRRTVLIAAATAAAAASTPALARGAGAPEGAEIALFDAEEPAARAFAGSRPARLAVEGDRIRFGRRLFRDQRPAKVVAMTRYSDFLLLAETAREEGYRTALAGQAPPDGAALFVWTAERA